MIPLFVDCSKRKVLVFGGGDVAARKCAAFAGNAGVTVYSRSFSQEIAGMPLACEKLDVRDLPDDRLAGLLAGAFLVIAALSDPAENDRIGRLCRTAGILFNNADGETGDVILPSVTRGDHFTLAISTGGRSPAIARFLREHIEQDYPALDAMIALQQRLRERLKETVPDQERRSAILWSVLADKSIWELLERDPAAAWDAANARYVHE